MRWQDVAKNLLKAGGSVGVIAVFIYLFTLTGVTYTHSPDDICDGLECPIYINVTTTYWNICFEETKEGQKYYFEPEAGGNLQTAIATLNIEEQPALYKKSTYGRTLWVNLNKIDSVVYSEPYVEATWYVPTIKRYADHKDDVAYWREVKSGDCWKRLYNNKNKIIFSSKEPMKFKWSFELDEISIDPTLISWDYVYENLSRKVPVYEEKVIATKPIYFAINDSWTEGSSYTTRTIVDYRIEYYEGTDKTGLDIAGERYIGSFNIEDDKLIKWNIPIGDRNFNEYGRCRKFEMEKGVCEETKLEVSAIR